MYTLIISAVFPPEPIVSARLSKDLANELSNTGEVVVVCPQPTRPQGFDFLKNKETPPYKVFRVNSFTCSASNTIGRLYESYSFGRYCEKYIKSNFENIKVIYINAWPLFSQYFIIKVAKKHNIKCITHIQDIYPESYINKIPFGKNFFFKLLLPIDKFILRNSDHIICISENMKNTLQNSRGIPSKKFTVIPNWQDEDDFIRYKKFSKNISELTDSFIFMYLGNNGPLAGVDFLIKCFINAKIPNANLIIAGTGSKTDACKKLVEDLNGQYVKFLPVPEGKVPEIQDMADVMLLPVKRGGAMSSIPSKLPAYMFSSKPILGSLDLKSDTAKAIIESDCGLVVEPENESELIKGMKQFVSFEKVILIEKGLNGFNYGISHFSKRENLQKLVLLLRN